MQAKKSKEAQVTPISQNPKKKDLKSLSFIRSLCVGDIEQEILFPFPEMKASENETLKTVFEAVEPWLKKHEADFRHWDRKGELPKEVIEEMKQLGLFSFIVPEAFGGLGLSSTGYSRMLQQLAKYDGSLAITAGAHSSIGMRGLLLYGTPEQQAKYFPKLSSGEMIAAFCLTEPGSGSDAASIKTKAVRDGNDWILSGEKLWITNGGIADFFTVFARTEGTEGQITAFIVTRDMKGVTNSNHEDKMGLRASSTTSVYFDQVRVPGDHVLGEVGKGFKVAMTILNAGRSGLGGGCVGSMKHLIELATHQANERTQFGHKIGEYGLIQQKIGHMMVECYAAESVVCMVAGLVDAGYHDYAVEAAISKVFATECLWRTADEALQIAGGNGYMCEFPYERLLRDARINRIFEGTNEILRLFIALTAMSDVGKNLKELASSLEGIFQDPIKGFGLLRDYGTRKISQFSPIDLKIGNGKQELKGLHPQIAHHNEWVETHVRNLSWASERILRKHGKKIINKQFASRRLGDIMIDLFSYCCVLSRVNSALIKDPESVETQKAVEILTVFAGQVKRRIKGNFEKIDHNDDEIIKSLALFALEKGQYSWDNLS